jgi:hypothetical protein
MFSHVNGAIGRDECFHHDLRGELDAAAAGFIAALDAVGNGGVLLNEEGGVIAANAKARSYLGQVWGLSAKFPVLIGQAKRRCSSYAPEFFTVRGRAIGRPQVRSC